MYPKDTTENKRHRATIIQEAENDVVLQQRLIQQCTKDPLYFFNCFMWTYNPRVEPFDFPFITYNFQDKFINQIIQCITDGRDNCTEKSRDMGFSWQLVGIHIWAFLFKGWSSLYGSYKEDYVDHQGDMDAFFERVRYSMGWLPKWMLPSDLIDKYMSISSKQLGAEMGGDAGQNFGTGGRRKFITMDEFALWQFADKAFRKTRDISSCRILGGTPEGRFNLYGKIMTSHKDYAHLDIEKIRLHWKQHPHKTQEWYENEKKNRTKLDVAKELDISYNESVTGAVYKDFMQIVKFGRYEYNPKLPLYTSWDFGRDTTCIIWVQHDTKTDTHYIIDSFQKSKYEIDPFELEFMRAFITGQPENYDYTSEELQLIQKHEGWRYAGHFGDPYNKDSKTINAKSSISQILAEKNIHVRARRTSTVAERINKTSLFMKKLVVDDRNDQFINAIIQSRYPETKENSQSTREKILPIHDDNSHFRTGLEYYVDNALAPQKIINPEEEKRKQARKRRLTLGNMYQPKRNFKIKSV